MAHEKAFSPYGTSVKLAKNWWIPNGTNRPELVKVRMLRAYYVVKRVEKIRFDEKSDAMQYDVVNEGYILILNTSSGVYAKIRDINDAFSEQEHIVSRYGLALDSLTPEGELGVLHEISQEARLIHQRALEYGMCSKKQFVATFSNAEKIADLLASVVTNEKVHARDRALRAGELIVSRNPGATASIALGIINNLDRRMTEIIKKGGGVGNRKNVFANEIRRFLRLFSAHNSQIDTLITVINNHGPQWASGMAPTQRANVVSKLHSVILKWREEALPRPFLRHKRHIIDDLGDAIRFINAGQYDQAIGRLLANKEGLKHMALGQEVESARFSILRLKQHCTAEQMSLIVSELLATAHSLRDDNLKNPVIHDATMRLVLAFYPALQKDWQETRVVLKEVARML